MDYELFIKNGMFAVRSDLTSFQYALLSLKIKKKSVVHASHVYNYTLKMVLNCFFFILKRSLYLVTYAYDATCVPPLPPFSS